MIDNIVADHLLLSDSRLERWLLRYSQNSGDGSGGGGGGQNSGSLVTKVQMENLVAPRPYPCTHPTPLVSRDMSPSWRTNASPQPSTYSSSTPSSTPMIDAYSCYVVAAFVGTSVTTAVRVVKQMVNAWFWSRFWNDVIGQCTTTVRTVQRS
jgi:transposase InsO family protein